MPAVSLLKLLKSVQENCKKYDALQTQIAQKLAENKNSQVSVSGDVDSLKQQVEELQKEIFSQSSTLTTQINIVIPAVQSKIDDLDSKKNEVDDLQSQVNELKKKIEEGNKALVKPQKYDENQLKDAEERLKNAKKEFPEKESKSLESHQTSMKSLKSLQSLCQYCDEVSKIDKNNENPKKLLESLTEGLENFLGYQDGNYTGEGIVYSDLDRLCDGVMSFLHGVLQSVKDDDNVKKYDDYISNEDHRLQKLLDSLQSSIGQGRSVFGEQVKEVSEWLKKYFFQVDTSAINVISALGELNHNVSEKYPEKIDAGESLQEQLKTWTGMVTAMETHINDNIITNVNNLDPALSDKIMRQIEPVQKVVEHLGGVAGNGGLMEKARKVDNELLQQKNDVISAIDLQTHIVQAMLNEGYKKISDKIVSLKKKRKESFGHMKYALNKAMGEAQHFLDNFNNEYWTQILRHFNDMGGALAEVDKAQNPTGDTNKSKLRYEFENFKNSMGASTMKLQSYVLELEDWIDNTKSFIDGISKQHVDEIVDAIVGKESREEVDAALQQIDVEADLLNGQFNNLKDKLNVEVEKVTGGGAKNGPLSQLKALATTFKNQLAVPETATAMDKYLELDVSRSDDGLTSRLLRSATTGDKVNSQLLPLIKKAADAAIKKLQDALQGPVISKLNDVNNTVTDLDRDAKGAHGAIKEKSGRIKSKLAELTVAFANAGKGIKKALQLLNDDSVENRLLKRIKPNLDTLQAKNYEEISNAAEAIDPIVTSLESLPEVIETKRQETDAKVKALKDTIDTLNGHFKHIEYLVREADSALERVIQSVADALSEAYIEAQNAIKTLKSKILISARKAFSTLTSAIRSLFSASHTADLQALRALVETQLREVQNIIARDAVTGVKGMLKAVSGMKFHIDRNGLPAFKNYDQNNNLLNDIHKVVTSLASKSQSPLTGETYRTTFTTLSEKIKSYIDPVMNYIQDQVKTPNNEQSKKIHNIHIDLDALLHYLLDDNAKPNPTDTKSKRTYIFDHHSDKLLSSLSSSISALSPSHFHGFHNPLLLDALKSGMSKFTEQLGHAYVNNYSGCKPVEKWGKPKEIDNLEKPGEKKTVTVLSTEGRNCAKVCLTILEGLRYELDGLRIGCKNPKFKSTKIHSGNIDDPAGTSTKKPKKQIKNPLGKAFADRGYNVASDADKQDGELRNTDDFTGPKIYNDLLVYKHSNSHNRETYQLVSDDDEKANKEKHGVIKKLVGYLRTYYEVTHHKYIPGAKAPCNINQMLQWTSGLRWDPMYAKISEYCKQLFPKPENDGDLSAYKLETSASIITAAYVQAEIREVCYYSQKALIAIVGYGHADGTYACDFYTNENNLHYPSNASSCLYMLVDILTRVCHQIRFVYKQCNNSAKSGGWSDCWYGQGVGGSAWNCNTMQCPGQAGDQTCSQKCDEHPSCGIKSPLQSFLEDGLQGFLPHTLTKLGCGIECSLGKHRGLPCKTPMGFNNIGTVASRSRTGEHIKNVLHEFCGKAYMPLSQMCNYLVCLLPSAPTTLGDMFGFYYNLLNDLSKNKEHRIDAFNKAVTSANFEEPTTLDITPLFKSSEHGAGANVKHLTGDLYSLVECTNKSKSTVGHPCGPYLRPLCRDVSVTFSVKHAAKYLSWVVYTTETFHSLLKKLYEECNGNCGAEQPKCRVNKCSKECTANKLPAGADSKHNESCGSIVKCQYTLPTLFKFGFVHENIEMLSDNSSKRTCKDLCTALNNVINEKENVKAALAEIIYRTIPDYLCKIRFPFMSLLLALWSLSLLYLLHITVVRLDALRIRSHLRSPASHRIAAQSLLAAARVKALANVKYFSP
ncbi:hypothetical protein, conserved [Babesia ovata]|uniref:C3H1-type domain-containing protein n=1 Tax=Babesia ovata TaxID=189622 RepID=A0A2H6KAJ5_9APIC|nr:uncharacterized protein BOVATA_014980 [Babesia ovata]GBE60005.1 hypothetical protein, conserved [Babesia ovata]